MPHPSPYLVLAAKFEASDFELEYTADGGSGVMTQFGTPLSESNGKWGKCLDLSNTSHDHIEISRTGLVDRCVSRGMVEFWVKPLYSGTPSADQDLVSFGTVGISADLTNGFRISHNSSGNLLFQLWDSTATSIFAIQPSWSPTSGTWYHVCCVWDIGAGASALYVDGSSVGTSAATGARTGTANKLWFGSHVGSTNENEFMLDDVVVYYHDIKTAAFTRPGGPIPFSATFVPSPDLVLAAKYDQVSDFNLTWNRAGVSNAPTTTNGTPLHSSNGKWGSNCLDLDNTASDSLEYNTSGLVDSVRQKGAISFWWKPKYDGFPAANQALLTLYDGSGNTDQVHVQHSAAGALAFLVYDSSAVLKVNKTYTLSVVSGQWYHVHVYWDFDLGTHGIFLDGRLLSSSSALTATRTGTADILQIGKRAGTATDAEFEIEEILIWDEPHRAHGYDFSTAPVPDDLVVAGFFESSGFELNYTRDGGSPIPTTINGTPLSDSSGKFGRCMDLANTSQDSVLYESSGIVDGITNEGTISFWCCPNYTGAPAASQQFVVLTTVGDNNGLIFIFHGTTSELRIHFHNSTGGVAKTVVCPSWSPVAGNWYHIEAGFKNSGSGEYYLFINGRKVASNTGTYTRGSETWYLHIGARRTITYENEFKIDHLIISDTLQHDDDFSTTLADSSLVVAGFFEGAGFELNYQHEFKDLRPAVINGTPTLSGSGKVGNCMLLGSGESCDYDITGLVDACIDEVTVSFWYKPGYTGTPANSQVIVCLTDGSTNLNFFYAIHGSDGKLILRAYDSSGSVKLNNADYTFSPTSGTWYHIEMAWKASTGAWYTFVGGSIVNSGTVSPWTRTGTAEYLRIGRGNSGAGSYINNYSIDEVCVLNTVQHTSSFTPPTTHQQLDVYEQTERQALTVYDGEPYDIVGPTPPAPLLVAGRWDYDNSFALTYARDGGDRSITTIDGTLSFETGKFGGAMGLDNTSQDAAYWSDPTMFAAFADRGAISFWVKPMYTGTPSQDQTFVYTRGLGGANSAIRFLHESADGKIYYQLYDYLNALKVDISFAWAPVSGTWYHFLGTTDPVFGRHQIFIDGVLKGSNYTAIFEKYTMRYLWVGRPAGAAVEQEFHIDELLIYNEVINKATYGFGVPTRAVPLLMGSDSLSIAQTQAALGSSDSEEIQQTISDAGLGNIAVDIFNAFIEE